MSAWYINQYFRFDRSLVKNFKNKLKKKKEQTFPGITKPAPREQTGGKVRRTYQSV